MMIRRTYGSAKAQRRPAPGTVASGPFIAGSGDIDDHNLDADAHPALDVRLDALESRFGTYSEAVAAAAAGDTIVIPPGIYRESITVDKPLTIIQLPGAEVRGSDDWSDDTWTSIAAGWRSTLTVPQLTIDSNAIRFANDTLGPAAAAQVFVDEQPQQLIGIAGETPGDGEYSLSASPLTGSTARVILPFDPTGHLIEVTTRAELIKATAAGVTLIHPQARHSAADARPGAINNVIDHTIGTGYEDFTVVNPEVYDTFGPGLFFMGSGRTRLYGGEVGRCGNVGVAFGNTTDFEAHDTKIWGGNYWNYWDWNWESGGMKGGFYPDPFTEAHVLIKGLEVYDCHGLGIWADVYWNGGASKDVIIEECRIWNCDILGIEVEISKNVQVRNNIIWNCGGFSGAGPNTAGIVVANSEDVDVYGNTVAWCADGIAVVVFDRGTASGEDPEQETEGFDYDRVHVYENFIIMGKQRAAEATHVGAYAASTETWAPIAEVGTAVIFEDNAFWWPWPEGRYITGGGTDDIRFSFGSPGTTWEPNNWMNTLTKARLAPNFADSNRYMSTAEMLGHCARLAIPAESSSEWGLDLPFTFTEGTWLDDTTVDIVSNSSSVEPLGAVLVVPARAVAHKTHFRITARGVYDATGTPNFTMRVLFGATVLMTSGAFALSANTNMGWELRADVVVNTDYLWGAGTAECQGLLTMGGLTQPIHPLANTATVAIDNSADRNLGLDVQFSAASASNAIAIRQMTVEVKQLLQWAPPGGSLVV